jgi:NADH-quinone oxidoreductase subunit M
VTPAAALIALLLVPALAAVLAGLAGRMSAYAPRWVAGAGLVVELLLVVMLAQLGGGEGPWLARLELPWMPRLGVALLLAADGLSLLLVALTALLGLAAIIAARDEVYARSGLFHCSLMACLTGAVGVFLALDLFLLLVFWQALLIPLFLLLRIWARGDRAAVALRFFVFTGTGGLFLLTAIVGLALAYEVHAGAPSFSYLDLRNVPLGDTTGMLLMLALFAACALRLPVVPFHSWLPALQAAAPAGVGVLANGVLLTTGGYGLLRLLWPLFPEAVARFAPVGMALGVTGVLYGAALACAQSDPGRRLAYLGLAHMGFVLLGVFAGSALALQGAVMQLLAHGLCAAGLLLIAGRLRAQPDAAAAPRLRGLALVFVLALVGLPGLAGFMGIVPILMGAYAASATAAVLAAVGLVPGALAALGMLPEPSDDRVAAGPAASGVDRAVMVMLGLLALALLWLGLRPGTVFDSAAPALAAVLEAMAEGGGP